MLVNAVKNGSGKEWAPSPAGTVQAASRESFCKTLLCLLLRPVAGCAVQHLCAGQKLLLHSSDAAQTDKELIVHNLFYVFITLCFVTGVSSLEKLLLACKMERELLLLEICTSYKPA